MFYVWGEAWHQECDIYNTHQGGASWCVDSSSSLLIVELHKMNGFCLTIIYKLWLFRLLVYLFLPLNFLQMCWNMSLYVQPASLATTFCVSPFFKGVNNSVNDRSFTFRNEYSPRMSMIQPTLKGTVRLQTNLVNLNMLNNNQQAMMKPLQGSIKQSCSVRWLANQRSACL